MASEISATEAQFALELDRPPSATTGHRRDRRALVVLGSAWLQAGWRSASWPSTGPTLGDHPPAHSCSGPRTWPLPHGSFPVGTASTSLSIRRDLVGPTEVPALVLRVA